MPSRDPSSEKRASGWHSRSINLSDSVVEARTGVRAMDWAPNLFNRVTQYENEGPATPRPVFPEGKVVRRISGSADALKALLLDLKKYSFSGYVRTIRVGVLLVLGSDARRRSQHDQGNHQADVLHE